jgi:hypothetical protein
VVVHIEPHNDDVFQHQVDDEYRELGLSFLLLQEVCCHLSEVGDEEGDQEENHR